MHLRIITLLFIIFEHINKIFAQGIPTSPCPKMFQYLFDGSEWFGILSVRNSNSVPTLQLRVTLSMRGKPMTNYLGEIQLLTRGQFSSKTPILYRIKFPENPFPPKLLQITINNQIACIGIADQGIFVTQIQLEHTRKFTFSSHETTPPSTTSSSDKGLPKVQPTTITAGLKKSSSLPTSVAFNTKHLSIANMEEIPKRRPKDVCGTIDDGVRLNLSRDLKRTATATVSATVRTSSYLSSVLKQHHKIPAAILMSTLLAHKKDEIIKNEKLSASTNFSREEENDDNANANEDGPLIISDLMLDDLPDSSMMVSELPTISRGTWPWLAAIYVNNLTSLAYQCTGTLVSGRIVISAAHCFHLFKKRFTASDVLVFLGRHNLKNWNEEGSFAATVDNIFIHPDYKTNINSYDADLAVVVLKNEIEFNAVIRPSCLWFGPTELKYIENEHGIVVGWGLDGFSSTTNTVPKIISAPVVSNDACFRANPKYRSLSSNRTFCAGIMVPNFKDFTFDIKRDFDDEILDIEHKLHQGPCTGDSGAGLMIFKNSRWTLRGIVSGSLHNQSTYNNDTTTITRSSRSCSIDQYVIYTDIAQFLDWIFAFII